MEIATREAVRTAAEGLAQSKPAEAIKVAEIREVIGGGSYTTITKRLAEWREERETSTLFRQTVPDMPDEVRRLWERMWQLADAQHDDVRDAWAQEKKKLSGELRERDVEIAKLESEVAQFEDDILALRQALEKAELAAESAEKERELAVARAETAAKTQEKTIEKLTASLQKYLESHTTSDEEPKQK